LHLDIPFAEALEQMTTYEKFMKGLATKKRSFINEKNIELEDGCSVALKKTCP